MVYYDFDRPLGNYIYGIDIKNKGDDELEINILRTEYTNKEAIENHENIVHAYDYIQIFNSDKIKIFNDKTAKHKEENGILYFEDRYIEKKDDKGNNWFILQPFNLLETNTLLIEEMTNKKYNNINKSNTRFLYQENLKDYIKLFKTKEELKNFFNK